MAEIKLLEPYSKPPGGCVLQSNNYLYSLSRCLSVTLAVCWPNYSVIIINTAHILRTTAFFSYPLTPVLQKEQARIVFQSVIEVLHRFSFSMDIFVQSGCGQNKTRKEKVNQLSRVVLTSNENEEVAG